MDKTKRETEEELIAELNEKHGRVAYARTMDGQLAVIRKPTRTEWGFYTKKLHLKKQTQDEIDSELVYKLRVYPSAAEFDAILEDWPGFETSLSNGLMKLTGLDRDVSVEGN